MDGPEIQFCGTESADLPSGKRGAAPGSHERRSPQRDQYGGGYCVPHGAAES